MLLLKYLCILSMIAITHEQLSEPGAACPKHPEGKCAYEEECPDSRQHGLCGADKNYKSLVCCTPGGTTKVLRYYTARQFPERTQCGRSRNLYQILGSVRTEIGEYPWVAALLYVATKNTTYGGVVCGGTLITEKFVLTAAHCVIGQTAESIRVLLGDWNITSDPDPLPALAEIEYAPKVINATIDKIISHELYSYQTKRNDVALLRLKTPVHFTDYVRPICLPSKYLPDVTSKTELVVAGWGTTETDSRSEILLKATLHALTNNQCLDKIQRTEGIDETELCAANIDSDACRGDSGGPLMRSYKDYGFNWFQLGIVGSGPDCRSFGATATIYTRVSFFVGWIIDQITPHSERDSPCTTPNNKNGRCVLVNQCPLLEQQYLQPGNSSEVELIRRSLCGFHRENRTDMVCCRLSQITTENAVEGSSCKTPKPESKDGRCVRITNCPALKNASKAAREHIQKYQCGFDDELLVCCNTQDIIVASEPKDLEELSSANIPNRTICGQISSDNTKGEYPWLAALVYFDPFYGYKIRCGGSLINKRFVLTAATCFDSTVVKVLLGTGIVDVDCHKTSDCPSSMQNLTVEQTILHPFFLSDYFLNNIALVRLGSNVVFNDYVSPICLPPPNLQPLRRERNFTMVGWTVEKGEGVVSRASLWYDPSCIVNNTYMTIHKQELCSSGNTGNFCQLVPGGSIIRAYKHQLGQNLFLEGINTAWNHCRSRGPPHYGRMFNVRISAYTNWILRTITETT